MKGGLYAMVVREARVRGIAPPSARGRLASFGPLVLVLQERLMVLLLHRRVVLVVEPVALFVLMGGHVPRQVVPFPEALVAHRTPELVHVPSLLGVRTADARGRPSANSATDAATGATAAAAVAALVVRSHVVHQIGSHAEAHVALGAHVLRR